MAQITTPATEALDAAGAKYEFLEAPGAISGEDYSRMVGADRAARLFKTLVMKGDTTGSIYVFVVPALENCRSVRPRELSASMRSR